MEEVSGINNLDGGSGVAGHDVLVLEPPTRARNNDHFLGRNEEIGDRRVDSRPCSTAANPATRLASDKCTSLRQAFQMVEGP